MAAGISDKLVALNNADLSRLAGRLKALQAEWLKTTTGKSAVAAQGGANVAQLLDELEAAQRRGLR